MKYLETPVWTDCPASGCTNGRTVDGRHLDNINASGGLYCPDHAAEVPC